ncbi:MAG: hypothetical protein ACQEQU_05345 [Spirochaetota bacterium]
MALIVLVAGMAFVVMRNGLIRQHERVEQARSELIDKASRKLTITKETADTLAQYSSLGEYEAGIGSVVNRAKENSSSMDRYAEHYCEADRLVNELIVAAVRALGSQEFAEAAGSRAAELSGLDDELSQIVEHYNSTVRRYNSMLKSLVYLPAAHLLALTEEPLFTCRQAFMNEY